MVFINKILEILPNSKIARVYALSYRIAQKVLKNNRKNVFLGEDKGFYCTARDNFHKTW